MCFNEHSEINDAVSIIIYIIVHTVFYSVVPYHISFGNLHRSTLSSIEPLHVLFKWTYGRDNSLNTELID